MHRFKPVHAYVAFALVVALVMGKDQAQQYDNEITACERGNVIREAIVSNSQIVRSNLRRHPRSHRQQLAAITALIAENGAIDCADTIDKPRYLP